MVYKVPYLIKSVGEEYQEEGVGNTMAVGKNITWEKENIISYNI